MTMWSRRIAGLGAGRVLLILIASCFFASPVVAQSAISIDGMIESKSGGFKFPDGSVQEAAAIPMGECPTMDPNDEMIWVGGICIDKFEASLWDAPVGGNQITGTVPCNINGQDCDNIWARSVEGVQPRVDITWFQAQAALANSGKRFPTNAEWQMAALGTPDPGDCHLISGTVLTGSRSNCASFWGHEDMVGNVWEWVADWLEDAAACQNWPSNFGDDVSCIGRAEGDSDNHFPGAIRRGGSTGSSAGVFAINALRPPSSPSASVGFRGAR